MNTRGRNPRRGPHALSLVEVMVAVGICAVAVVGVVALFGPAVRDTREVADRRVVHRLGASVDEELRRNGFLAVSGATTGGSTLQLVARVDGSSLVPLAAANNDPATGTPRGLPLPERYYLIEVARALRPASSPGCLVLEVRVSWPFVLPPDGTSVPAAQRSEFRFHTGLNP